MLFMAITVSCVGYRPPAERAPEDRSIQYESEWRAKLAAGKRLFRDLERRDGPMTVETVLVPLNDIEILISNGTGLGALYARSHPDRAMRESGERAEQAFASLGLEISLSSSIYRAIKSIDLAGADADTRRYVERTLMEYRLAGVDQDDDTRAKIKRLQDEILKAEQEFEANITADVRSVFLDSIEELAGLPDDYIDNHQPDESRRIEITTAYPDALPFFAYSTSDARRQELSMKFNNRGYPQNVEVLERLIAKRHELAALLGHENWAGYVAKDKMIGSAEQVEAFIDKVSRAAQGAMERDLAALLKWKRRTDPGADKVNAWENGYLSTQLRNAEYSYDEQEAREYFAYDKVRDGLFEITGKLFGVRYRKSDQQAWHEHVEFYEVFDGDEMLGSFFLDSHPREGKLGHAGVYEMRRGVERKQLPQAALLCNFARGDGTAALMSHHEVSTLFHEFGHLLHFLFAGQNRWAKLSGFSTEWDFVETPALMLEEWIWDAETLQTFATNEPGEPIPRELVERMNAARNFGKGINIRWETFYAAASLHYHNRAPEGLDTTEVAEELTEIYCPYDFVPGTHFEYSFPHLSHHSATYYTYLWSRMMALDLFSRFEAEGMMKTEVAMDFRRLVLEPGGSKPAATLVRDFLGRDYSFEAFARWLEE
jgi:thimet oligopeptidase